MSQELKCSVTLRPSKYWLLLCIAMHSVVLGLLLNWLTLVALQLVYTVVIIALCSYHCWQHWLRRPCFVYFTNGYIQFDAGGELFAFSKDSRSADLFIQLSYTSPSQGHTQSLYIMRDAIDDADYRRLVRTIKILK
ncbi:protein YgfX [Moritella sp.]|uniref:protein YgfX n=1 Tax=Moritella sp. TaxID=78556 RepID=UPI0025E9EBCF|nr:protein YgfX [Moritella sp.]